MLVIKWVLLISSHSVWWNSANRSNSMVSGVERDGSSVCILRKRRASGSRADRGQSPALDKRDWWHLCLLAFWALDMIAITQTWTSALLPKIHYNNKIWSPYQKTWIANINYHLLFLWREFKCVIWEKETMINPILYSDDLMHLIFNNKKKKSISTNWDILKTCKIKCLKIVFKLSLKIK